MFALFTHIRYIYTRVLCQLTLLAITPRLSDVDEFQPTLLIDGCEQYMKISTFYFNYVDIYL